jgi:N-carbamoyl-L-amino-acid hydrolase
MIFVPCRAGVSHNPAEWAEPTDLTAGAKVLADALYALADRP